MLATEHADPSLSRRFLATRPPTVHRVRFCALGAGLGHAALLLLAFPPFDLWFLALIAPLPLGWIALVARHRPLVAAFWAGVGTLPFWIVAQHWVISVSSFGFLPLAILLSGFNVLLVWASARIFRLAPAMLLLWPLLWVGIEFFRSVIFLTGYPWYLLAHPLAGTTVLNYLAPLGGTFLVSAVAALPSTAVLAAVARMHPIAIIAAAGDFVFFCLLGLVINPWPSPAGSVRIAIVQTSVPQSIKTSWTPEDRYADWVQMRTLIAYAAREQPDLIALPEAMFPGMTLDAESLLHEADADLYWSYIAPDGVQTAMPATLMAEELIAIQRVMRIPVLIGGAAYERLQISNLPGDQGFAYDSDGRYNSVFVLDDGMPPTKRYDKVHLTPFGEIMPVISRWPWLENKMLGFGAQGMRFDLLPGRTLAPVNINLRDGTTLVAGTPICFESTMPAVCRRLGRDAQVLINLTNDGWFGQWDPGREHHLLTARWRSIELGKPLVRVANTGISCVFDERGREIARGAQDPRTGEWATSNAWGLAIIDVPMTESSTFYAKIGDVFGWACFLGTASAWLWTFLPTQSRRKIPVQADEQSDAEHRT